MLFLNQQTQICTPDTRRSHHACGRQPQGLCTSHALFLPVISVHHFLTSFRFYSKANLIWVRPSLATRSKIVPSPNATSSTLICFMFIPFDVYTSCVMFHVYFHLPHWTVNSLRMGASVCAWKRCCAQPGLSGTAGRVPAPMNEAVSTCSRTSACLSSVCSRSSCHKHATLSFCFLLSFIK